MKTLLLDIETAPNLGYIWGKYEQNVLAYERETYMMCFAYKWLGGRNVKAFSLPDFSLYKKQPFNDRELVKKLWLLFDEADIVIAHNGDAFDIKKTNARFLFHRMLPPSPYRTIDTVKVARKYFNMNSNKLNDISSVLQLGEKLSTGGFELWQSCMQGDLKSWKKIVKYNKQDVNLLEKVYLEMRKWMNNHPNQNVVDSSEPICPTCGGHDLQKRGFGYTQVGKYQRYQCKCGAWSKGRVISSQVQIKP